MADRVILLNAGRIEQNGAPVELYEHPANTFVARFIGTPPMNLLRLAARDDGAVVAGTDGPVVLPAACAGGMLGVRPEHVALAQRGVRADVLSVEYLGGDSLVVCCVGDGRLAVRAPGRVPVRAGDAVDLDWPPEAVHYFESSGRSVGVPSRRGAAALA